MARAPTLTALETETTMIIPVLHAVILEGLNIFIIPIGTILMLCKTLPRENLRRMTMAPSNRPITVSPSTAPSVRCG